MASIFTKIINGELPGRFVWKDSSCVAFMTVAPLKPGHVLVVPREEVDHWIDLEPDLVQHLALVAQTVSKAIQSGFQPMRVGLMVAGIEVPHVHLHLVPISAVHDLDFSNADNDASAEALDAAAETVRRELRAMGCAEVSD
ncbi:MAG: HIT family protein [Deltaproteobacteria bacterium]|nr:HIT family protein [Deltaproteobacteria bacterium]MBW2417217.1 HIT family protein [Deltaproteobacteria bacterium]